MYVCTDEKQLLEFRQQEVDVLQRKVTTFRTELKTEMKQAKQSNEAHVRHLPFIFVISVGAVVSRWLRIWLQLSLSAS